MTSCGRNLKSGRSLSSEHQLIRFPNQGVSIQRSITMPFVSIRITREGTTPEQKAQVIKEVTEILERVLHKPPEWTHIAIEEVDTDNWGFGGRTTTAIRKEGASQP
jgi:4-oxalocrotonate tautomerase